MTLIRMHSRFRNRKGNNHIAQAQILLAQQAADGKILNHFKEQGNSLVTSYSHCYLELLEFQLNIYHNISLLSCTPASASPTN